MRTFLNSWPQAGRTWIRTQVNVATRLHEGKNPLSENLHKGGHFTMIHDDWEQRTKIDGLHPDTDYFGFKAKTPLKESRVILLVRDPRDLVISNWVRNHGKNPGGKAYYRGDLPSYIRDDNNSGFRVVVEWFNIWEKKLKKCHEGMLLRYEDMKTNGENELKRVLDFLNLGYISYGVIRETVDFCRFKNMKKIEHDDITGKEPKENKHKMFTIGRARIRKGESDTWMNYFDEHSRSYIAKHFKRLPKFYGYK